MSEPKPEPPTLDDLERIARKYAENHEEPTYACIGCLDVGFVMRTRPGHQSIYGKHEQPIAYSHKCACRGERSRWSGTEEIEPPF